MSIGRLALASERLAVAPGVAALVDFGVVGPDRELGA
jgi:hypothetical protein